MFRIYFIVTFLATTAVTSAVAMSTIKVTGPTTARSSALPKARGFVTQSSSSPRVTNDNKDSNVKHSSYNYREDHPITISTQEEMEGLVKLSKMIIDPFRSFRTANTPRNQHTALTSPQPTPVSTSDQNTFSFFSPVSSITETLSSTHQPTETVVSSSVTTSTTVSPTPPTIPQPASASAAPITAPTLPPTPQPATATMSPNNNGDLQRITWILFAILIVVSGILAIMTGRFLLFLRRRYFSPKTSKGYEALSTLHI